MMPLKTKVRAGERPRLGRNMKAVQNYHFVGIGGCGMSGLAQVLRKLGHQVSGTDQQASSTLERLCDKGISVRVGHAAEAVPAELDCLVISAAVKNDNPELVTARQRGVRVLKYAQLLGELSAQLRTYAIAGTHGKSTTSGWLSFTLHQAGLDPSFVVGANVGQLGSGSGAGQGPDLVVEACEYDRSFLNLRPTAGAILNVEADHLDYYKDIDEIVRAFSDFAALIAPDGLLVANGADANVSRARAGLGVACETFALQGDADWLPGNLKFETGQGVFEILYRGQSLGRVKLTLPGTHNVTNALAVAALAHHAGAPASAIRLGLENFLGVGRRMSYKGAAGGVVVLDDYAHHPTEIRVTLEAIRARYQPRRLWCVFQPHQHSRTRFLLQEFATSFNSADIVLLPDIYFVRDSESLRREVSASQLADLINQRGGRAHYLGDFENILGRLTGEAKSGDLVVTMGAGDVWKVGDEFIRRFAGNRQVG